MCVCSSLSFSAGRDLCNYNYVIHTNCFRLAFWSRILPPPYPLANYHWSVLRQFLQFFLLAFCCFVFFIMLYKWILILYASFEPGSFQASFSTISSGSSILGASVVGSSSHPLHQWVFILSPLRGCLGGYMGLDYEFVLNPPSLFPCGPFPTVVPNPGFLFCLYFCLFHAHLPRALYLDSHSEKERKMAITFVDLFLNHSSQCWPPFFACSVHEYYMGQFRYMDHPQRSAQSLVCKCISAGEFSSSPLQTELSGIW